LSLLRDRNQADLPRKATMDVARVLNDPRATPDDKAKALVIEGLALRNQEKYAEAKAKLGEGLKELSKDERGWIDEGRLAQEEAANPAAFVMLFADKLANEGRMLEALERLNRGIAKLTEGQGPLLAQRSLLELEMAKHKTNGRARHNDPQVAAAQKDAEEAAAKGSAMGHYAAAKIAEELGDYDDAIARYQAAEMGLPAEETGMKARCRVARARLLTLPRQWRPAAAPVRPAAPVPPMPPPEPEANKVGRAPAEGWEDVASVGEEQEEDAATRAAMLALVAVMLQPVPGQLLSPDQVEAQRIADEILEAEKARPGSQPPEVVAQALAIKGLWTQALRKYVEAIRLTMRRDQAEELARLIEGHPSLRRPDSLRVPNPIESEAQYASGVREYFCRHYPEAEQHLLEAIRLNGWDARYYYFLGLSRLMQGNREAYEDFNRGALLEKENMPGRAQVSQALERVQGPIRHIVNEARQKPGK
jgi:tetratricopeptide (TPR) repeat protein